MRISDLSSDVCSSDLFTVLLFWFHTHGFVVEVSLAHVTTVLNNFIFPPSINFLRGWLRRCADNNHTHRRKRKCSPSKKRISSKPSPQSDATNRDRQSVV